MGMRNKNPTLAACPECSAGMEVRKLRRSYRALEWVFSCVSCLFITTRQGTKEEAVAKFNADPKAPEEPLPEVFQRLPGTPVDSLVKDNTYNKRERDP